MTVGATPDVTVVVPAYNALPYLRDCLESLARQSIGLDRMQVVVVDDGSTDGSATLLDEYAARYDAFEVVHQPNSGGPARPCSVGLGLARGRFVFFLGADDYLGDEALERFVAAADRWESDIVCGKTVGLHGRVVLQKLYAATVEDLPFPSELLTHAVSNTKLFRRSLLTEHDIDYPLDLRVASDQPFTIKAMRYARKISVLTDYEFYHGVKRHDQTNLTYSTGWRVRVDCIAAVMDWVVGEFEPGETRDAVLHRHFGSELSKVLRRDFPEASETEQKAIATAVGALAVKHLTPGIERRLHVLPRLRLHAAADGRVDDLRALVDAQERSWPVLVGGDSLSVAYPGYGQAPDSWFEATADPVQRLLNRAIGEGTVSFDGTRLLVEADTDLTPKSAPHVRAVLVRAPGGRSKPPRKAAAGTLPPWQSEPARIEGGRLIAALDLDGVLHQEPMTWALRIQVFVGSDRYTVPVALAGSAQAQGRRGLRRFALAARPDAHGRALVDVGRRSARRTSD